MGTSYWPLFLIIGSNVCYHLSSRFASRTANPFAALVAAYLVGAAGALALYFATERTGLGSLVAQAKELNGANLLLGLAIIGLEGGFLYLYRAGWSVSVGPILSYTGLAVALLAIGALFLGEHVGWRQVFGVALCLAGIALVTPKA